MNTGLSERTKQLWRTPAYRAKTLAGMSAAKLRDSPWHEADVAILKARWPTRSASQISRDLEYRFTRNAVIGKAHRLGLPAKREART